jgi:ABC-type Na+ transport system ATPase subunit NatA/ABC-type transport system involved in multi-copper enzyme maturation permease subunit
MSLLDPLLRIVDPIAHREREAYRRRAREAHVPHEEGEPRLAAPPVSEPWRLPPASAISARGLTRDHGRTRALSPITFDLTQGEVVALTGANGAGKTTLLALLAGILTPTRGFASICGRDGVAARGQLGFCPAEPALYARLTVREHLDWLSTLHGRAPAPAVEDALALRDLLDRPTAQLSSGQRRRAALALALAHEPAVALLDEPLATLDREGESALLALIAARRAAGLTTLLASPSSLDRGRDRAACDRVVALPADAATTGPAPTPRPTPQPFRLAVVGRLLAREWRDLRRDRRALLAALVLPLVALPVVTLAARVLVGRLMLVVPTAVAAQAAARAASWVGHSLFALVTFCMFAAVLPLAADAIAGERERRTFSLLLSAPVSRLEIAVSKFAPILTLATVVGAGALVDLRLALGLHVIPIVARGFALNLAALVPAAALVSATTLAASSLSVSVRAADRLAACAIAPCALAAAVFGPQPAVCAVAVAAAVVLVRFAAAHLD